MEYFAIIIGAIFVNNVVLAQFLGICPFLGVSSKVETSMGMGAAVTFVMALSSVVVWLIQTYILVPLGIEFMQTIVFILVIASLVQFVEIILKKFIPPLYKSLGVYLPLITTNCVVLGVANENIQEGRNFISSMIASFGVGIGFLVAMLLFAGVRSRIENCPSPKPFKGIPITLVAAAIVALAFGGFASIGG